MARTYEGPKWKLPEDHLVQVFHGCNPFTLPQILAEGFRGTLGSGMDEVQNIYGVIAPLAYCATNFTTATQYPEVGWTPPCEKGSDQFAVTGTRAATGCGMLVSTDGTYPLRCVLRCIMSSQDVIRRRSSSKQVATMPRCLWITHIIFFAVHPVLCSVQDRVAEVQHWQPADPEGAVAPNTATATCAAYLPVFFKDESLAGGVGRLEASEGSNTRDAQEQRERERREAWSVARASARSDEDDLAPCSGGYGTGVSAR